MWLEFTSSSSLLKYRESRKLFSSIKANTSLAMMVDLGRKRARKSESQNPITNADKEDQRVVGDGELGADYLGVEGGDGPVLKETGHGRLR